MKILLIDDSKTMRTIERRSLAELPGVEFVEAGDGLEALAAIARENSTFDIVLTDWNMPNMDGLTFTKAFRAGNKSTPLMMVTTEGEKGKIIEAIRAGANNYVIKPFTPEVLREKVKQTLANIKPAAAVGAGA